MILTRLGNHCFRFGPSISMIRAAVLCVIVFVLVSSWTRKHKNETPKWQWTALDRRAINCFMNYNCKYVTWITNICHFLLATLCYKRNLFFFIYFRTAQINAVNKYICNAVTDGKTIEASCSSFYVNVSAFVKFYFSTLFRLFFLCCIIVLFDFVCSVSRQMQMSASTLHKCLCVCV